MVFQDVWVFIHFRSFLLLSVHQIKRVVVRHVEVIQMDVQLVNEGVEDPVETW